MHQWTRHQTKDSARDHYELGYVPAVPGEGTIKSAFMRGLEKSDFEVTEVTVTDRAGQLLDWRSLADTAWERLRLRSGGPLEGDGCARCASPRHSAWFSFFRVGNISASYTGGKSARIASATGTSAK